MMRSFLTQGRRSSVASRRHFCTNGLKENVPKSIRVLVIKHCVDRFVAMAAGYTVAYAGIKPRAYKVEERWKEAAKVEAMLATEQEDVERVEREIRSFKEILGIDSN